MDTETKAVRDGAEEPLGFADAGPTLTGTIAADIMGLAWAKDGCSGDHADDIDMACERHGQVQEIVEAAIGKFAAPSAAGGGERPGDLDRVPEAYREKVRAVLGFTDEDWLLLRACFPEVIEQFRQVIAAAPSPSQGSDTGEAGRDPGAYGIPGMPANLSNSDNLRLFSVHHADRLPKAAQDDLCRLADEWDEEIEVARRPVPPPTAPQGADLAGLSAKAYRGPWSIQGGAADGWIAGPESDDEGDVIAECPEFGCDESRARFPANAAFIVALVNAYREGKLVSVQPALAGGREAPAWFPTPETPEDAMAVALLAEFQRIEPQHPISQNPVSWVATFVDLARVALAQAPAQPDTAALRGGEEDWRAGAEAMREACARFAEADRRTPLAKEHGYFPRWQGYALELAAGIRALPLPPVPAPPSVPAAGRAEP